MRTPNGHNPENVRASRVAKVSLRFFFLSLVSSVILGFVLGRIARTFLPDSIRSALVAPVDWSLTKLGSSFQPEKALFQGKTQSDSIAVTDSTGSSSSDAETQSGRTKLTERSLGSPLAAAMADSGQDDEGDDDDADDDDRVGDFQQETAQHLFVDIGGSDPLLLSSERRLSRAMAEVSSDGLLSCHCHSFLPSGISCIGVFLQSRCFLRTWPDKGVILIDIFTTSSNFLVSVIPAIEQHFLLPRKPDSRMKWYLKPRGSRDAIASRQSPLENDLRRDLLGRIDLHLKKQIVSTKTDFQEIDIYEYADPRHLWFSSYMKSISSSDSYESLHAELFRPDRVLFMDGIIQSTRLGEEAYHEALVHPGMFSHPNPKRVAIIGGGEGATLREVLKHKTVKKVIMIEIDEVMVNLAQKYLPSWVDCSDLIGCAHWCVDDDRAEVYYEDALAWFIDRFSKLAATDDVKEEPFDVIIMDLLDPESSVDFAVALYQSEALVKALYNGLTANGVLIQQQGESPYSDDSADELEPQCKNGAVMIRLLQEVGFESIHEYEEAHSGLYGPWSYIVSFKAGKNQVLWYSSEPEVEFNIRRRIIQTKSGTSALKYFDSATMKSYQVPHKAFETTFCRKPVEPEECHKFMGFNLTISNEPSSSLEVKRNPERGGFGVFTTSNIPKGSAVALDQDINAIHLSLPSFSKMVLISQNSAVVGKLEPLLKFVDHHGCRSNLEGSRGYTASSDVMMFVHSNWNESYNIAPIQYTKSGRLGTCPNKLPSENGTLFSDFEHIVLYRHLNRMSCRRYVALQPIRAGEELISNILPQQITSLPTKKHMGSAAINNSLHLKGADE